MEQEYKYMVCTRCFTFNHAPYIVDAMNGFTMQETTFPVITLIVDDASQDGEPDVIRQYLVENFQAPYSTEETDDYYLICANHTTNPNCTFVVFLLKYNHYSIRKAKMPYLSKWLDNAKYISLCEGDDYWIHPKKLQMQVEFLESHLGHTLCIHAYRKDIYDNNNVQELFVHKSVGNMEIVPNEDVLKGTGMFAATASMVYRSDAIRNYPEWARRAPVGDRPLQLVLFSRGHVGYLNDVMSVYRVGIPGSWTQRVNYSGNNKRKCLEQFIKMYQNFDEWTNGRYHSLIQKGIHDLKVGMIKDTLGKNLHKIHILIKSCISKS